MNKDVKVEELFECRTPYLESFFKQHVYPWEMLPEIKYLVRELITKGISDFREIKDGVYVGQNVKIADSAFIEGPVIIGHGCEIRHCAYLRGNVITGDNCVIGNSTEIKNSILLNSVQVPHYNYVGDSVLGNRAHMGAGAICSNLKADKKDIVVHGDNEYETGLRKMGAIIGDGADIGCGCVLNPGAIIGKNSSVYPLTSIRGVISENSIVKSEKEIILKISDN